MCSNCYVFHYIRCMITFYALILRAMVQPFGNGTVHVTSQWTPEPNGRGTWSLLSTCVVTILLCVWSAVHLNIPEHERTKSQYWRKVKWLFLGLFAPELVAYVAWQQRQEATKICQEVRAIYGQPKPLSLFVKARRHLGARLLGSQVYKTHNHSPPPSPKVQRPVRSAWEEVHGFFVLMGGFAFTIDSSQTKFLPDNTIRTTLTPDGLRFLLHHEPDALPDITAEQIKDKSKADGLKKTVVCIQALWFCAQCINRLAQSLPVCLLELNTFGHALCTLAIYIFWWEKPLDIEEPTIISDEKLHPIFAYMWMSSRVSAKPYSSHDMPHGLQDEFHCIWPFEHPDLTDLSFNSADLLAQTQSSTSTPHVSFNNRASPPETTPNSHSDPPEPQLRKERPSYLAPTFRLKRYIRHLFNSASPSTFTPGLSTRKTAIHALSPSSLSRRSLALTAINTYGLQSDLSSRHQTATSGRFFIPYLNLRIPFLDTLHNNNLNPRLELRAPNALFSVAAGGIIPGFAVSGALYGSLHLAAWRAPFPSEAEKILWRTSSISVTCTGIVFGLMALTIKTKLVKESFTRASYILGWGKNVAPKATNSSKSRRWLSTASSFFVCSVYLLLVPCLPWLWFLYLFSRGYLVVESLRSVAYLPAGAFQTPSWPSYIPHIT